MKWISVEDRLPDKRGLYFAYRGTHSEIISYFPDQEQWIKYGATVHPTHWMPLPEPPRTE